MKLRLMSAKLKLAFLATFLLLAGCTLPAQPQLITDATVAPDLDDLAQQTWRRFMVVFGARADCFGDVTLSAAKDLDSRAIYNPQNATLTVKVPATAALLQEALVHEWAHHVEHQCPEHLEMRPAFLAAQKLPEEIDWFGGQEWEAIPSEQYAEAAIILVLGQRQVPTAASVSPEAVNFLKAWAVGE